VENRRWERDEGQDQDVEERSQKVQKKRWRCCECQSEVSFMLRLLEAKSFVVRPRLHVYGGFVEISVLLQLENTSSGLAAAQK
jgi:hypothetical protein